MRRSIHPYPGAVGRAGARRRRLFRRRRRRRAEATEARRRGARHVATPTAWRPPTPPPTRRPAGTEATTPGTGSAEEVQTGESLLDTVIANDVVRCGVARRPRRLRRPRRRRRARRVRRRLLPRRSPPPCSATPPRSSSSTSRPTPASPALQAGEIDVLVRNTTWTASRDGGEGATFLHPTFYDGQEMMVAADSGFASIDDMDGAVVCVAAGTTTEGNVATEFAARGLTVEVQSFDDIDLIQEAFIAGQCDGWSSDVSQLAGSRSANYPDGPEALVIFERGVLQGAARPGRRRRRHAVGAGRRVGDLRHDPGRGVRHHVGERRRLDAAATTPPSCTFLGRGASDDGARRSTRVSACRPTSPSRSSPRSATTARSSSANLARDRPLSAA